MSYKFCSNCGTQTEGKFCPNCGHKIEETIPPTQAGAPQNNFNQVNNTYAQPNNIYNQQNSSYNQPNASYNRNDSYNQPDYYSNYAPQAPASAVKPAKKKSFLFSLTIPLYKSKAPATIKRYER